MKVRKQRVTYLGIPAEVEIIRDGDLETVNITWLAKAVGQPVEYSAGTTTTSTWRYVGKRREQITPTTVVEKGRTSR